MSRTTRRRAIRAVAPVAGLLAAGLLVWQGSYAAFSATTTSPSNNWASGSVVLKNNSNGSTYVATGTAVFNVSNMVPSATVVSKCITVESSGSLAGAVKFYATGVTPSTPSVPLGSGNGNLLSSSISVTVQELTGVGASTYPADCTGFPVATPAIYSGPLSGLPAGYGSGLGSFAPNGAATQYAAYRISYGFNPGTAVVDVQGRSASATFVWEIQTP